MDWMQQQSDDEKNQIKMKRMKKRMKKKWKRNEKESKLKEQRLDNEVVNHISTLKRGQTKP